MINKPCAILIHVPDAADAGFELEDAEQGEGEYQGGGAGGGGRGERQGGPELRSIERECGEGEIADWILVCRLELATPRAAGCDCIRIRITYPLSPPLPIISPPPPRA